MNITLMEKVYKDNQYVLYINGFVGASSKHSMISIAIQILTYLGYKIIDVNYLMQLDDDVPNNEADYWHEGNEKIPVIIEQSQWVNNNDFPYHGFNLKVNGETFKSYEDIGEEMSEILNKMGHPCTLKTEIDVKDETDYNSIPEIA